METKKKIESLEVVMHLQDGVDVVHQINRQVTEKRLNVFYHNLESQMAPEVAVEEVPAPAQTAAIDQTRYTAFKQPALMKPRKQLLDDSFYQQSYAIPLENPSSLSLKEVVTKAKLLGEVVEDRVKAMEILRRGTAAYLELLGQGQELGEGDEALRREAKHVALMLAATAVEIGMMVDMDLTISRRPLEPFAMGNHIPCIEIFESNRLYRARFAAEAAAKVAAEPAEQMSVLRSLVELYPLKISGLESTDLQVDHAVGMPLGVLDELPVVPNLDEEVNVNFFNVWKSPIAMGHPMPISAGLDIAPTEKQEFESFKTDRLHHEANLCIGDFGTYDHPYTTIMTKPCGFADQVIDHHPV